MSNARHSVRIWLSLVTLSLCTATWAESPSRDANDKIGPRPVTSIAPAHVGKLTVSGVISGTGADNCANATVVQLPIGTPGSPVETTISGDNTGGTGGDCTQVNGRPVWWEAFELTDCATVTITLCGTDPSLTPFLYLLPECGSNCGTRIFRTGSGSGAPFCTDSAAYYVFDNLSAGTYYYAIPNDIFEGAYELHIFAEACVGACCDLAAGTCTDDSWADICDGPDEVFNAGDSCCQAECLPNGEEYAHEGVELLSHVPSTDFHPSAGDCSDVWGYVSPSGREYAIVGFDRGTGFAEVTDPFNAHVVGFVEHSAPIWRDMKTYAEYAYSVNDSSGGGMDVIDLTQIDDGTVTLQSTFLASGFQTAHNVVLNSETAHIYLVGSNLGNGGLISVDVSNPTSPTIDGAWTTSYVHDALVVSYDDGPYAGHEIAFLFGSGNIFSIVDVTNKSSMVTRATLFPTSFGHQGWITEDRKYIIFGDEGQNFETTAYVINVEDLDAPFLVDTYHTGLCTIDHNMMIRGQLIYHADYTSGLRVFDITDPPNAQQVAYFDTHPEGQQHAFEGAWGVFANFPSGVVLLSDIERGLFVFDYDCNVNGVDDTDDIANLTSQDCNANGMPDECEWDANNNGTPDSCEFAAVSPPLTEPDAAEKNRFISFVIPNETVPGEESTIRVELQSLHHPTEPANAPDFTAHEGEFRYVNTIRDDQDNPVLECADSATFGTSYNCAVLGCEPEYRNWHADFPGEVLHVFGPAVVPSSQYSVAFLSENCVGQETACSQTSAALSVATSRWGDVDPGQLNILDVAAVVRKVKEIAGSLFEPQTLLQPNVLTPDTATVNVLDIAASVQALKDLPYPYAGPATCP